MEKRIALVGYSYRLPQTNTDNFWQNLLDKNDLITEVESKRWSQESLLHTDKKHPGTSYTYKAGSLGDISLFDAEFFGISPREAAAMDPQQRHLLEMTWEAIEHAGIKPSSLQKSDCGVFIGIASLDYSYRMIDDLGAITANTATGITSSLASNRISYAFDLHGPSFSMDTACSSSMVAFHQACQSILSGEVSTAIAGGISLHLHPFGFIIFSKATMLSPNGRCRVFDEAADGYVRSEGGGIFLLKDYDQAIKDGDIIHAIVASSVVNTDGHKSGLTIPSCVRQTELMERAYQKAGISVDEIDYLEAHGTGTPVGDPIETLAIGRAIGKKRKTPLPIGSVKSNLGHLETASGVAGLAKALLVIKHRAVPATIGINKLNPAIKCDEWNLQIVDKHLPLKQQGAITVGVNSFGFGGSNAHIVLRGEDQVFAETLPSKISDISLARAVPLIISAKSEHSLLQNVRNLIAYLDENSNVPFYDIAWNYSQNKERHADCVVIFASNSTQAKNKLQQYLETDSNTTTKQKSYTGNGLISAKGPVFVYSGNGCQWQSMGKSLLQSSDVFRQAVEEVDQIFSQYADFSLIAEIAGENGDDRFEYTEIAQPALFAVQVAITKYLQDSGVVAEAVIGHSVGEVAAAWACGALSLQDAVKVIYYRSLWQGKTKGRGAMSAVGLSQNEAEALLQQPEFDKIHLAGVNSFRGVTLAGSPEQLSQLETHLTAENTFNVRLALDYAFHSPVMDAIEQDLLSALTDIKPVVRSIPFYSTVTGGSLSGLELDNSYWWNNIRQPVLFQQAMDSVIGEGFNCFIEVGAHPVLRSYQQDQVRQQNMNAVLIPTLSRNKGDLSELQQCSAAVIMAGAEQLQHYFPESAKKLQLPSYAWQQDSHWFNSTSETYKLLSRQSVHPLLGSPLPLQPLHWENSLDSCNYPWLADHRVGDSIVYPGAGFIEMMLNAASYFRSAECIEIEELEVLAPLILEDESSKVVQTRTDSQSGEIKIVSRTHSVSEQWTLNCKARAYHQPTGFALDIADLAIPDCPPDFDAQYHQQQALRAGLQYGPAFSAVESVWCNGDQVLAKLNTPGSIATSLDSYLLHPGILDSAIQLVIHFLAAEIAQNQGIAYIPTRVERLTYQRAAEQQPAFARLQLVRRSGHSLLIDFELFDRSGKIIARMQEMRFKAVRLYKDGHQQLSYLNYRLCPVPSSLKVLSGLTENINQAVIESLTSCQEQLNRYNAEVVPLLDHLMLHATAESFTAIFRQYPLLDNADIEALNLLDPYHQNLRLQLLNLAQKQSLISRSGDKYQFTDNNLEPGVTSQLIWNTLVREYPDFFSAINLAGSTSLKLTDKFLGNSAGIEEANQLAQYQGLFKAGLTQTYYPVIASALQSCIRVQQQQLVSGQKIRVLEVAAAQNYYAETLCSELNFDSADYTFASDSLQALDSLSNLQERYPLLNLVELAQDSPVAEPLICAEQFQLVVVTFDHYSIENNLKLLERIKPYIANGASILVNAMQPLAWLDLSFAAAEDWWQQQKSVQVTAKQWLATLQGHGFNDLSLLTAEDQDSSYSVISATWNNSQITEQANTANQQHWLVLASDRKKEQLLLEAIATAGAKITLSASTDLDQLVGIITNNSVQGAAFDRVIMLNQMGDNADPLQSQSARCHLAGQLLQALENTHSQAQLWCITEGVGATIDVEQQYIMSAATEVPADSAFWGFARTLMNESLNNSVRLVDLPMGISNAAVVELIKELQQPSEEQELLIATDGGRYAPRLRFEPDPAILSHDQNTAENIETQIKLNFNLPGQLRNLQWQAGSVSVLADDEIDIEVKATGLNFRDIMYALGMLSDEAIENGFAGASLGLEFSGLVKRVGKDVAQFSPGDDVVGFGSACFSNRIIAKGCSIAVMPEGVSYEGAATIPTTFLTVYYALQHLARLRPGEKVLIHGAAGGVGIAAIQIAQWLGAEIYATVGSEQKREFLELMGVKHIYNSRELTFAEDILRDTHDGRGVDVVLNSLAGEAINQNFRVLKPFGRFLELGKRDFYENSKIGLRPFRNNISYFGIDADQLQKEQPQLTAKLFAEIMQLFNEGTLAPLPFTQFNARQVIDAFRYMQQAKQIGKVIVTYEGGLTADVDARIKADTPVLELDTQATYLVTGGLGGFGLKTAQWLVQKGARYLLLLSRRGAASSEAKEFLQQCSAEGVMVRAEACDVADKVTLQTKIDLCGAELPELKGIIHAATVIDDSLIRNLDRAQIERSLSAKLRGAQLLDELSRNLGLDMFVLYSSVTTLWGNPGQAAYVAANHYLEALTATRKAQGLAATCVRWGAIDDVGFLARNQEVKESLQNRLGGDALNSEQGLQILQHMLLNSSQTLGVMELQWSALSRFLPSAAQNKFREIALLSSEVQSSDENRLDLTTLMAQLSEKEFKLTILEVLTNELSEILMLPVSKINPEKSIYDMGMDSLMGVELMSAVEARIGIRVPVMALTETPKLSQLVDKIISLMQKTDTEDDVDSLQAQARLVALQHGEAAAVTEAAQSIRTEKNGTVPAQVVK